MTWWAIVCGSPGSHDNSLLTGFSALIESFASCSKIRTEPEA